MQRPGKLQRIQHPAQGIDGAPVSGQTGQLRVKERNVECRVMNDELGTRNKRQQLIDNFSEAWLALEIGARDAVYSERAFVDIAFWIEVAMERSPGGTA